MLVSSRRPRAERKNASSAPAPARAARRADSARGGAPPPRRAGRRAPCRPSREGARPRGRSRRPRGRARRPRRFAARRSRGARAVRGSAARAPSRRPHLQQLSISAASARRAAGAPDAEARRRVRDRGGPNVKRRHERTAERRREIEAGASRSRPLPSSATQSASTRASTSSSASPRSSSQRREGAEVDLVGAAGRRGEAAVLEEAVDCRAGGQGSHRPPRRSPRGTGRLASTLRRHP